PDARAKLSDRERLRDVVVGPELEPEHLVELVVAGREHDDRHRALAPEAAADLEPVDLRKHDVEHDEVDRLLREPAQSLVAVAGLDDAIGVPLERVREGCLDRILVVDEENGRGGVRHLAVGHARACTPARAYYSPLHGARPPRAEHAEAAARLGRAPGGRAPRAQDERRPPSAADPADPHAGPLGPAARAGAAARVRPVDRDRAHSQTRTRASAPPARP